MGENFNNEMTEYHILSNVPYLCADIDASKCGMLRRTQSDAEDTPLSDEEDCH